MSCLYESPLLTDSRFTSAKSWHRFLFCTVISSWLYSQPVVFHLFRDDLNWTKIKFQNLFYCGFSYLASSPIQILRCFPATRWHLIDLSCLIRLAVVTLCEPNLVEKWTVFSGTYWNFFLKRKSICVFEFLFGCRFESDFCVCEYTPTKLNQSFRTKNATNQSFIEHRHRDELSLVTRGGLPVIDRWFWTYSP